MFKYAHTCILNDIMSKMPSRAIIPKADQWKIIRGKHIWRWDSSKLALIF
jgi:hypothetical protein